VQTWLPDDPYPLALIIDLPDVDEDDGSQAEAMAEALGTATRAVRRALALASELGDPAPPATFALDPDPTKAGWMLAGLAPLGPSDRQQILRVRRLLERLVTVGRLATEMADVLAYRLAGG
jgi:Lon protease-like protein